MMKTLFLQAPSFDGFNGGAGARYQMSREVRSFWYPTWLAQPAALVEGPVYPSSARHRGLLVCTLRMASALQTRSRRPGQWLTS
jgi:hypothetical protein